MSNEEIEDISEEEINGVMNDVMSNWGGKSNPSQDIIDGVASENEEEETSNDDENVDSDNKKSLEEMTKEELIAYNKEIETKKNKAEEDKANMSKNLSGMREKMDKILKLKEEISVDLPNKKEELVYSNNLPFEQLETMTEYEKKMHDDLVRMKVRENERVLIDRKKDIENKTTSEFNSLVKDIVSLHTENPVYKEAILKKLDNYKLDGLSVDEINDRVEDVKKIINFSVEKRKDAYIGIKSTSAIKKNPTNKTISEEEFVNKAVKNIQKKNGFQTIVDFI